MSYKSKIHSVLAGTVFVFLAFASILLLQGTAHAAAPIPSNTLPESSDFSQSNQVWLHVAQYDGVNYFLDAQTSTIRLYSSNPNPTVSITSGRQCVGNGPDQGATEGEVTTVFNAYALTPNQSSTSATSAPYQRLTPKVASRSSNQLVCGTTTLFTLTPYKVNGVAQEETDPQYIQYGKFAWEIEAIWQGGAGGWNGFKYSVSPGDGRFSYYAGSGDHFALKAQPGSGRGNFSMGFAPNCNLAAGATANVTVRWFDADAGVSNQGPSPVKTALIAYDGDNNNAQDGYANIVSVSSGDGYNAGAGQLYITSGNNTAGSAVITIKGHHKYRWIWYDINDANGIQFQLPTDSYNTLIDFTSDCNNPTGTENDASCVSVTATPANPAPNQGVTLKVVAKNVGTGSWTSAFLMRQTSPPGRDVNVQNGPIKPGSNAGFTFNLLGRPAGTSVTFMYQMVDDNGKLFTAPTPNPLCQIRITWSNNPPSAQGGIVAGCQYSSVSIANVTATWHPPANVHTGAAVAIGRVPAVIVITDTSDGSKYSFIVKGTDGQFGIPNGGSTNVDTFNMWPAMYPHKSYSMQLYAEGLTGGDSLTYNNDGFWNPTNNANDVGFYYGISPIGSAVTVGGDCFSASCGEPVTVDAEPGQTKTLGYGIHIVNSTNRTYPDDGSDNGYSFAVGTSGGLANVSGPSPNQQIVPGDPTNIVVNFTARIDYTGNFWIILRFQGQPMTSVIPTGTCGGGVDVPGSPGTPGTVTPATRAYFEVRGGDISTGGGFADAADVCPTTAPGYISPATGYSASSGRYDYAGGIRAYGTQNGSPARGSSSDFGALALGLDIGNPNGPIGFFSRHNELFAGISYLPGSLSGNMGGYLSPSGPSSAHCVSDYFTKTRQPGVAINPFGGGSVTGKSGVYESNSDITLTASTITSGQRLTLYVSGNVTIDGNIAYTNSWNPINRASVPYFTLIVKGNITLTNNTTRLDGFYVAQPQGTTFTGIFNTCDNFCPSQLIVNGAVIAQEVQLNRAHGTMGPCEPASPTCALISQNPAEIFNYAPSLLIGLPELNPTYNTTEAEFSLPPVF